MRFGRKTLAGLAVYSVLSLGALNVNVDSGERLRESDTQRDVPVMNDYSDLMKVGINVALGVPLVALYVLAFGHERSPIKRGLDRLGRKINRDFVNAYLFGTNPESITDAERELNNTWMD
jgi:hypothetical protein